MITADVRSALGRTGALFTQHENDPGHIPDFWRATILGLCDALDAAPAGVADILRQERDAHAATKDDLANVLAEMDGMRKRVAIAEGARARAGDSRNVAVQLVAEAAPRMRTLNNAMSPEWLARSATLLGE